MTKINTKYHPLKILFSDKGRLKLFLKDGKNIIARQMLKDVYIRNGVFYIFSIKELKKQKTIYLKNMIVSESNYKTVNINFTGSVAYYLSHEIHKIAKKYKCKVGCIIQSPIEKLVEFHFRK